MVLGGLGNRNTWGFRVCLSTRGLANSNDQPGEIELPMSCYLAAAAQKLHEDCPEVALSRVRLERARMSPPFQGQPPASRPSLIRPAFGSDKAGMQIAHCRGLQSACRCILGNPTENRTHSWQCLHPNPTEDRTTAGHRAFAENAASSWWPPASGIGILAYSKLSSEVGPDKQQEYRKACRIRENGGSAFFLRSEFKVSETFFPVVRFLPSLRRLSQSGARPTRSATAVAPPGPPALSAAA